MEFEELVRIVVEDNRLTARMEWRVVDYFHAVGVSRLSPECVFVVVQRVRGSLFVIQWLEKRLAVFARTEELVEVECARLVEDGVQQMRRVVHETGNVRQFELYFLRGRRLARVHFGGGEFFLDDVVSVRSFQWTDHATRKGLLFQETLFGTVFGFRRS